MKKVYEFYNPVWRNYFAGTVLTTIGTMPFLFFYNNLLSLIGFPQIFIFTIYLSMLHAGISYLRKAHKNVRLKITHREVLYRKDTTSRGELLVDTFGLNSDWISIALRDIVEAEVASNIFLGNYIKLTFVWEEEMNFAGTLSKKDKYKIVEIIKIKIANRKSQK